MNVQNGDDWNRTDWTEWKTERTSLNASFRLVLLGSTGVFELVLGVDRGGSLSGVFVWWTCNCRIKVKVELWRGPSGFWNWVFDASERPASSSMVSVLKGTDKMSFKRYWRSCWKVESGVSLSLEFSYLQ